MRDYKQVECSFNLQRYDQDILNALSLVKDNKDELQKPRNGGWENFVSKVVIFFNKLNVEVPDMDAT